MRYFGKDFVLAVVIFFLLIAFGARSTMASQNTADAGLCYLQSQIGESGEVAGFGGESDWTTIAFVANGYKVDEALLSFVEEEAVQKASGTEPSTFWSRKILSAMALGADASNFSGVNLISKLEESYRDGQFGESFLVSDDLFALLVLSELKPSDDKELIESSLNFILDKQDANGGFSWSADTSCDYCGADSDDTAVAILALLNIRENVDLDSAIHAQVDESIARALAFLVDRQSDDGGFMSTVDSFSNSSSTAWSMVALNKLIEAGIDFGITDLSVRLSSATNWLSSMQTGDGGFEWMTGFGSDTSTTSHALIAFSDKGWIFENSSEGLRDLNCEVDPEPSPTPTPTPTPEPTPTPTPEPSPTPTPTPSPTPTPAPTLTPAPVINNIYMSQNPSSTASAETPSRQKELKVLEESQTLLKKLQRLSNPSVLGATQVSALSEENSLPKNDQLVVEKTPHEPESITIIIDKSTAKSGLLTLIGLSGMVVMLLAVSRLGYLKTNNRDM